jgi:hypothetical protein
MPLSNRSGAVVLALVFVAGFSCEVRAQGLYEYVYLNEAKINNLYDGTVKEAVVQIRKTSTNIDIREGRAKVSLGALFKWLSINPELSGQLSKELDKSVEVVQKLDPVQKLTIVRGVLEKDGEVVQVRSDDPEEPGRICAQPNYVVMQSGFRAQGKKGPTALQKMLVPGRPEPIVMIGRLNEYKIRIETLSSSFVSLSTVPRFFAISGDPKGIPLEVFGVAISCDDHARTIDIDPIAMYYKGREP